MKSVLIAIIVKDTQLVTEGNIKFLSDWCQKNSVYKWQIVFVHSSNDDIDPKIQTLIKSNNNFSIDFARVFFDGKGFKLKSAWLNHNVDIYSYVNLELIGDIDLLLDIVRPVSLEIFDVAIGSRGLKKSVISQNKLKRIIFQFVTRLYKFFANSKIYDLNFGMKAASSTVVFDLMPRIVENKLFFDTEFIWLIENFNYRILEVPVRWEDLEGFSSYSLKSIILYLKILLRLKFTSTMNI